MPYIKDTVNLVLSGGGIKGLSYLGVFETAGNNSYKLGNIAGVSAGALAGSFAGAGYNSEELSVIMNEFDFEGVELRDISRKLNRYYRLREFSRYSSCHRGVQIEDFLRFLGCYRRRAVGTSEFYSYRAGIIQSIVELSKEGYILDGDALEEWVYNVLKARGIRTFADFRGGLQDKSNPNGYKVRMTAVDANRARVITLPDDITYYGMEPDNLEVAKAVRMSTSVPFAFKPVELKANNKTHYLMDGGVFNNFPFWLIDNSKEIRKVGFKLDGGPKRLLNLFSPLNILKSLISAVHDIGIPKNAYNIGYVVSIDTSKVSFLDFKLSQEEKDYLYKSGKKAGSFLFGRLRHMDTHDCKRCLFCGRVMR